MSYALIVLGFFAFASVMCFFAGVFDTCYRLNEMQFSEIMQYVNASTMTCLVVLSSFLLMVFFNFLIFVIGLIVCAMVCIRAYRFGCTTIESTFAQEYKDDKLKPY